MKKIISLFVVVCMLSMFFSSFALDVYGGDETTGITSVEYDGNDNAVYITTDTTYYNAVVCAVAYRNQKIVSMELKKDSILANMLPNSRINFKTFDSRGADYVKIMVLKSKSSFKPLCPVSDFDEAYLKQFRKSYAYITDAYYCSMRDEMDGKVTLRVVCKDGYLDYPIADSLSFVGYDGGRVVVDSDEAISYASSGLTGSSWNVFAAMSSTVGDSFNDVFGKKTEENNIDDVALRTVFITINIDGEIDSVTPLYKTTDYNAQIDYNTFHGKYDENSGLVDSKKVSDSQTIIYIDYQEPSRSLYKRNSSFVNGWGYTGLVIDSDANQTYNCAVITSYSVNYSEQDSFAVVDSVYQGYNSEGEIYKSVVAYKDCEEVTLTFDNSVLLGNIFGSDSDYNSISKGSVIIYSADSDNYVYVYDVVGNVTYSGGKKTFSFDPGFKMSFSNRADYVNGSSYFYGYIADFKTYKLQLCIADSISDGKETNDMTEFFAPNDVNASIDVLDMSTRDANMYTLTGMRQNSSIIYVNDYMIGNINKMYISDNMGTETVSDDQYEVYYVLVKMYEGVVTDIISFDVPTGDTSIVTPFDGAPLT